LGSWIVKYTLEQWSATTGPRPSAGPCYRSVQNKAQIAPKTAFSYDKFTVFASLRKIPQLAYG